MSLDELIEFGSELDGVLTLRPGPGDGSPELAWGDVFFYYAPDGVLPPATQPFATIVTKDYPDDAGSRLDRPGAFRANVAAGREAFRRWTGRAPREPGSDDPSLEDTVIAHPVYGSLGWLAVVNPGPRTDQTLRELITGAYGLARARVERRSETHP
ncbi:DUF6194 family protein [Microlunatus speluncae]|uniref:DUF6194 family protein n=1 Tax=Microlunatus speluncae TaxID=2594267 RepID=UPI0012665543|nr:DUF6194 family protein [Microlunatus speluncae]